MSTVLISVAAFLVLYGLGFWVCRPLGWRLFRLAHHNNPEALAFADREQSVSTPKEQP